MSRIAILTAVEVAQEWSMYMFVIDVASMADVLLQKVSLWTLVSVFAAQGRLERHTNVSGNSFHLRVTSKRRKV